MNIAINRLVNCAVYIDGDSFIGRAERVKIAKPKAVMVQHKGLGMVGKGKLPAGIDELEAEIKWSSVYAEIEIVNGSPFETHDFQVRGNLETYIAGALTEEVPYVYLMTASFIDAGPLEFQQHENVDRTSTLAVYHCEESIAGVQTFLYDWSANLLTVDGIDQLANFRANLGG